MASAEEPAAATEAEPAEEAAAEAEAKEAAKENAEPVEEAAEASKPAAKPAARAPPQSVPAESEGLWVIWVGVFFVMCAVVGIICYFFPPYWLMRMVGFGGNPNELDSSNWAEMVAGKTVFIKFYASWCGHCKRMKPAWDSLMSEYTNHSTILVADVECSGAGKSLCDANGVRGFPTIKYGDPEDLQDYKGGRDLKALRQFAKKELGPLCGPKSLELCDDAQRAQIEEFRAMGAAGREELIKEKTAAIDKVEADWKAAGEAIQQKYKDAAQEKEDKLKALKDGGLGLLKQVQKLAAASRPEL